MKFYYLNNERKDHYCLPEEDFNDENIWMEASLREQPDSQKS